MFINPVEIIAINGAEKKPATKKAKPKVKPVQKASETGGKEWKA